MNVSGSWGVSDLPRDIPPTITSVFSAIPTSSLQLLVIGIDHRGVPWAHFKEPFSSVVLRCGPSFTVLNSPAPLSDAAINHLIQLPHLHTWSTGGPPPNFPPSSLPLVLPSLVRLTLRDSAAYRWLPLFESLEHGVPTTQDVTPLSKMKESLRSLDVRDAYGYFLDASFTSPFQLFRNLISLNVDIYCDDEDPNIRCAFELDNDNVTKLTMALSQLESLPRTPMFQKYLHHNCRLPPLDFRLLRQVARPGDPLQHQKHYRRSQEHLRGPPISRTTLASKVYALMSGSLSRTTRSR